MTDEALREAERRWRATKAVEDEATYLLARVRAGRLERRRLELAAFCGHAGAMLALGETEEPIPTRALVGLTKKRWGDDASAQAVGLARDVSAEAFAAAGGLHPHPRTVTALQVIRWTAGQLGLESLELAAEVLRRLALWALATAPPPKRR